MSVHAFKIYTFFVFYLLLGEGRGVVDNFILAHFQYHLILKQGWLITIRVISITDVNRDFNQVIFLTKSLIHITFISFMF